ncbi:MAG: calcium/sodium antiporter [Thermoflexales bacterium]|nr:calcium/sodium antiporter [Thermoflexales bacterium]
MNLPLWLLLVLGLGFLFAGGELLIRGAARLGTAIGISPLIVGLTIVAFTTSAPELAVSLQAAAVGQADLVIGNVVGSNISNVLLILGLSALIAPLVVRQRLIRLDVPIMIGVSILVNLLALDGHVSRLEGALLFSLLLVYLALAVWLSGEESRAIREEYASEFGEAQPGAAQRWPLYLLAVAAGLGLLLQGANWLVEGAVALARWLGVSELIIGLTIVAVGTSLPEMATSLIAAARGERDIAVGNVVGSNIFNLLSVLGLTATVAPDGVAVASAALAFDLPVMIAVAVACLPVFFNGYRIERWEGALFVAFYVAYIAYLVLAAVQHDALPLFSNVMLWFVIPLAAITLLVVTVRALRANAILPDEG